MTNCSNCGYESSSDYKFCPSCGTRIVVGPEAADTMLGRILNDKYRVLSEIGSGSMGKVYLGEHLSLKKKIALKLLHPDLVVSDESLKRFQGEGIAAGKFTHPGAIQIFDFDRDDADRFYLVMEYVEGPTLRSYLAERGKLPAVEATDIACQILAPLAEAHRHGIVHRDLKPDNIIVMPERDDRVSVKVLDFGLSKLVDRPADASLQTQPGRIIGTPRYMAPEQWIADEIDQRSDLYAVGLILYELLAGAPPFDGKDISEALVRSTTEPAPSIVDSYPDLKIPSDLDDVLGKALEKRRDDRFQTAAEMIAALDQVRFDRFGRARRARRSVAAGGMDHPPARSRARWGWLAGAAAAAIVITVVLASRTNGESPPPAERATISQRDPSTWTDDERAYVRLLEEARAAARRSDLPAALASLDEAVRLPCEDPEALLLRADLRRLRGRTEEAILDYQDALDIDPTNALARAGLGWAHFARGETSLAASQFENAIAQDPDCVDALVGQAAIDLQDGHVQAAAELLAHAIALDENSAIAHSYLGDAKLEMGDTEGSIEAFRTAKRIDSRLARAYVGLGRAFIEQDQLDEAEKEFEDALTYDPGNASGRAMLAIVRIDSGRLRSAIEVLDEGLANDETNGQLHVLRGAALQGQNDLNGAVSAIERGLRLSAPASAARARALTLLGQLYHQQGQLDTAIDQYRAAIAIESHAIAHLNLGLALFKQNQHIEALAELETALQLDGSLAYAHFALGILYMDHLARPAEARAHFLDYLDLGGEDARVKEWLNLLPK